MARIIFYEKPGCGGNARQKALLVASGHDLEARSLLAHHWTVAELMSFFGARPVAEWFNLSSPRVKSGEIEPASLDPQVALALMLADPLLIRRPLMEVEGRREVGFDPIIVNAWIGLKQDAKQVGEGCVRTQDQPPCAPAALASDV